MRVLCTSDLVNPEVRHLVGETDHQLAWTPNLSDHIALAATGERSAAGIKVYTAPLEPSTLTRLREAVAPLLAAGPFLPGVVKECIEVVVSTMDAAAILKDPGSSKGLRLFCTTKAIEKAEETLLDILTPVIPALKSVEPWNFCVSVLIDCGDKIFAADLVHPQGLPNEA